MHSATPRDCPPPAAKHTPPTRFVMPRGATDTHAHVIGLPPEYPLVAERSYTPAAAPAAAYLAMLDGAGLDRGRRGVAGRLDGTADRLGDAEVEKAGIRH